MSFYTFVLFTLFTLFTLLTLFTLFILFYTVGCPFRTFVASYLPHLRPFRTFRTFRTWQVIGLHALQARGPLGSLRVSPKVGQSLGTILRARWNRWLWLLYEKQANQMFDLILLKFGVSWGFMFSSRTEAPKQCWTCREGTEEENGIRFKMQI